MDAASIRESEEEIRQIEEDMKPVLGALGALRESGVAMQNTTCALSGRPLEIPTIHFMSGKSYNLDSVPEGTDGSFECPMTSSENNRVLEAQEGLRYRATRHEDFFRALDGDHDEKFGVIADYLGRSTFN